MSKRPAGTPRKTAKKKKSSNKPFGRRFPERGSTASRILATNLRRLREIRKLSQKDLADAIKTDQAAISLIENGRANPTLLMIEQIAGVLRVAVGELLAKAGR